MSKIFNNPGAYHLSVEGEDTESRATNTADPSINTFAFGPILDSGAGKKYRAESSYYSPQEEENWGGKFWCDITAADYFLVLFTLVLAASTIGLWLQTERLAEGAERQAGDNRKAIEAATRQADAAEAQIRPYVQIVKCHAIFRTPMALPSFEFEAENKGTGIAQKFRWNATVAFYDPKEKRELRRSYKDWMTGEIGAAIPRAEPITGMFGIPDMSVKEFAGAEVEHFFNFLITVQIDFNYRGHLPKQIEGIAYFSGIAFQALDKTGDRFELMNNWLCDLSPTTDPAYLGETAETESGNTN